jgi:hypothetical protein
MAGAGVVGPSTATHAALLECTQANWPHMSDDEPGKGTC